MELITVELLSQSGGDQQIAEAALVSSGRCANRDQAINDALVTRLITDRHLSCLEHVTFKFRVKAPYRILVQMLRHRVGMSYNMASARYGFNFEDIYYPVLSEIASRAHIENLPGFLGIMLDDTQRKAESLFDNYKEIIKIAKGYKKTNPELCAAVLDAASFFLPQGVMCELIVSCNLRSVAHFISLRDSKHAQAEIRKIAVGMKESISDIEELSVAFNTLESIGWLV